MKNNLASNLGGKNLKQSILEHLGANLCEGNGTGILNKLEEVKGRYNRVC